MLSRSAQTFLRSLYISFYNYAAAGHGEARLCAGLSWAGPSACSKQKAMARGSTSSA